MTAAVEAEVAVEVWAPIPGISLDYEVSNRGRVRSFKRSDAGSLLATPLDSRGRPAVCLERRARRVHQLVALAFLGAPPPGTEVCHRDGDKTNNALSNLRYGTHGQNIADQVAHGTHYMSNRTHCPQGHPYSESNTYVTRGGLRQCRECTRSRGRARRARVGASA